MRKSYLTALFICVIGAVSFFKNNHQEVSVAQTASFVPDFSAEKYAFNKKIIAGDTLSWKILGVIKYVKRPTKIIRTAFNTRL